MTQDERRLYLIDYLLSERTDRDQIVIPPDIEGQRQLLRALMNVRPPEPVTDEFLAVQDDYLHGRLLDRGVVTLSDLEPTPADERLFVWRGDICRLATGSIVNAANSQLLGCFVPGHHCIDNAIHTYAGVQLRLECNRLMVEQGHEEPTGTAKLTGAYNLPSAHVIHTVGPIVFEPAPTTRDEFSLRSCYRSCLAAAEAAGDTSIAFCCISTGVFRYPFDQAAQVAISEVKRYLDETGSQVKVVFNVFLERDEICYKNLLG